MIVTGSFAEARAQRRGRVGLVPTMGFLHEGHVSLLDAAREADDIVVMSLFVNPLQFGDATDLETYPRDRDRDLEIAEKAGVDVVFAPSMEEMYPREPITRVVAPAMTRRMEGAHRPGHFEGVATVVAKLLAGVAPQRGYFGRKDAQQLALVTRLAGDLSLPAEIVPSSTVRESDGLALSSRNVRLGPEARQSAVAISAALFAAADAIETGELRPRVVADHVAQRLGDTSGVEPEYVEWAVAADCSVPSAITGGTFLATAARVGGVRLIDNIHVDAAPEGLVVDRGVRIDEPSMLYRRKDT